jgi:LPS O-antigen subunit length determinant protein (WzzB/FepE family)
MRTRGNIDTQCELSDQLRHQQEVLEIERKVRITTLNTVLQIRLS